ncbi:MAG: hypothetical protein IKW90_07295 [Lachnospiraceae bacterium]|nr:hypothetical protein [Lachnospiraceae bacterium]
MKKFFKALALLLALVLVIGSLPVAAAEQSDFALKGKTNKKNNLKQKIIYIGGAKGVKDDEAGTVCKTGAWANVAKLVKGFDADTMYIELESSDKEIVRTESGKKMAEEDKYWIKSKAVGTATVTVKVFRESDDFLLYNEDLFVSVKKNAEAIKYQILDAEGNDVTDQKLGANTDYTVKLTRLNEEGAQIDTDLRNLEGDKDAVAIEVANDYTTLWKVNFKKSGKVTLKATAFQSKTYNKALLSQDIDVTVGYDVASVAQNSIKAVDVTFKQNNVAGLTAADFKAYYELTNGTKYYPSAVEKVTVNENVATVQFFSAFKQDTEYFLEYNGEAYSFKTAKIDKNSVASIVVNPTKVKAGSEATISYKLLNAEGIDITGDSSLNGYMMFEGIDLPFGSYVSNDKVYIQNAGVSGKVKVAYNWTTDQGEQKSVSAEGQVYSVAADKWVFSGVQGVATTNTADSYVKADNKGVEEKVIMKPVTMDYASTGAAIQIAVKYDLTDADGKISESKYESLDKTGFNAGVYDSYELKSNDETVVMLKGQSGKYMNFITNKVGTANVIVYGVKGTTKDILGVVTIEVKEAKKASSFTASLSKALLNKAYPSDSIEITAVLKNQYDEEIKGNVVTVKKLVNGAEQDINFQAGYTGSADVTKVKILASDVATIDAGTVTIVIKTGDFKFNAAFQVGNESAAASYALNLSGNALDTNVVKDNEAKTIAISVTGQSKGFATSGASIRFVEAAPKAGDTFTSAYTDGEYVYTVKKDNNLQKASDLGANFAGNTFTNVTKNASGAAVLLGKGSYNVEAYKVKNVNGKITLEFLGAKAFTVTDNQTGLTWTKTDKAEKISALTNDGIKEAFEVKFGNDKVTDVTFDFTQDGTTAYVKTVSYTVVNEKGLGSRTVTATVDTLVKKQ